MSDTPPPPKRTGPSLITATCAGLMLLSCVSQLPAAEDRQFPESTETAVRTFLDEHIPGSGAGLVIGLADEHGSRVLSAGTTGDGTGRRVDGDTLFEIGSITKTFTSLLLLDTVRRGEVHLEDPVAKYLPPEVDTPTHDGKEITLLNLAVQDSGLPFNADNFTSPDNQTAYEAFTVDNLYAFLASYELTRDPGAGFQYSNVGMSLLGHVMELKTGIDYESLVVDRICRPLEMQSTRITLSPGLQSRMAVGHDSDGNRARPLSMQVMVPAGSLCSTANDLLKYLSAQLGLRRTVLNPLMQKTHVMRHRGSPEYGTTAMPWVDQGVYQPPGADLMGHSGGTFGFSAFIGFDKRGRRGVVVLSNHRAWIAAPIGWAILQEMPLTESNRTFLVREVVGIGAALAPDEPTGLVRITRVFAESPAGRIGLSAGMLIRTINGMPVKGESLADCLQMMAGPAGTEVMLEFSDSEGTETRTVTLTKQKFLTSG